MTSLQRAKLELRSFAYLESRAKDVLEDKGLWAEAEMKDFLSDHLRHVMPVARAYNSVMRRHDGNPVGVEYEHYKNPSRFAVVLPDASCPGKFRVQFFDQHGFSSHDTIGKMEEAVEEMVRQGYRNPAKGVMAYFSEKKEWQIGNATIVLLQKLNAGEITHEQFLQQRDALHRSVEEMAEAI